MVVVQAIEYSFFVQANFERVSFPTDYCAPTGFKYLKSFFVLFFFLFHQMCVGSSHSFQFFSSEIQKLYYYGLCDVVFYYFSFTSRPCQSLLLQKMINYEIRQNFRSNVLSLKQKILPSFFKLNLGGN